MKIVKVFGVVFAALFASALTVGIDPVRFQVVEEARAGSPCFDQCVEENCKPIKEPAPPYTNWARCVKACSYQCRP